MCMGVMHMTKAQQDTLCVVLVFGHDRRLHSLLQLITLIPRLLCFANLHMLNTCCFQTPDRYI